MRAAFLADERVLFIWWWCIVSYAARVAVGSSCCGASLVRIELLSKLSVTNSELG